MEKHFRVWNTCPPVRVLWKNLEKNTWQGLDPLLTTGQGYACVIPEHERHQNGCLSDASNQSQPLMGPMKRLQLDKLNLSRFNFGLMLLGLLSTIWLKRLITHETNHHRKEKFLNTLFIKNKKGGDVGNPQDPQSLLERSGVTVTFMQQP
jgi:hypothetical protein